MTNQIEGRSEMSIKNRYNSFVKKIFDLKKIYELKDYIYLN